jgi:hypothetical protein
MTMDYVSLGLDAVTEDRHAALRQALERAGGAQSGAILSSQTKEALWLAALVAWITTPLIGGIMIAGGGIDYARGNKEYGAKWMKRGLVVGGVGTATIVGMKYLAWNRLPQPAPSPGAKS